MSHSMTLSEREVYLKTLYLTRQHLGSLWLGEKSSDVNKDWTCKDNKDKDQAYKDQDKDKD